MTEGPDWGLWQIEESVTHEGQKRSMDIITRTRAEMVGYCAIQFLTVSVDIVDICTAHMCAMFAWIEGESWREQRTENHWELNSLTLPHNVSSEDTPAACCRQHPGPTLVELETNFIRKFTKISQSRRRPLLAGIVRGSLNRIVAWNFLAWFRTY